MPSLYDALKPKKKINDPNNAMGSKIGTIGSNPVSLAPTGSYAAGAGLQRARDESGLGTRLVRTPGGQTRVHPMAVGVGLQQPKTYTTTYKSPYGGGDTTNFTSTGRPASARIGNNRWTMPSLASNDQGQPSLLNGKPVTPEMQMNIAQNRARQGMSLDDTSRKLLASGPASLAGALAGGAASGSPMAGGASNVAVNLPQNFLQPAGGQASNMPFVPGQTPGQASLLGNRRPYRGPDARNIITQRAQQATAARQLRMAGVNPSLAMALQNPDQNVRNVAMGGPRFAGQMAQNAGLEGMRNAQAGLATAQASDLQNRGQMMNDPNIRRDARIDAALASGDPAASAWALDQLQQQQPGGASLANRPPPGYTPPQEDVEAGFTPADSFALRGIQGNRDAIADYGRQQGWPQAKIDNAINQFGGSGAFGAFRPGGGVYEGVTDMIAAGINPPLVGPPPVIGLEGQQRRPTKPLPPATLQRSRSPWAYSR